MIWEGIPHNSTLDPLGQEGLGHKVAPQANLEHRLGLGLGFGV